MEFVFVVPRQVLFLDCTPHGLQLFQDTSPAAGTSKQGSNIPAAPENRRDGLQPNKKSTDSELEFQKIVEGCGFFVERDYAERTPALKQVIPYTIVFRRDDQGIPQIFRLVRTKAGGEARLHNKLSIGVGGHIEPVDLPSAHRSPRTPKQSDGLGRQASAEHPSAGLPESAPHPRNPIPGATRREVLEEELDVSGPWQLHAVGLINDDTNPVGAVHVGLVQLLEVSGEVRVRETEQLIGLSLIHI